MGTKKRVNYTELSDQELLDLFGQTRDRDALAEVYERYRKPIGHYLYRTIKNKTTVADAFNTIMLRLVSRPSSQTCERELSIRLFKMAYELRQEYASDGRNQRRARPISPSLTDTETPCVQLGDLPRQHRDVLELVYQHNFSFDEASDIMGCSVAAVRNCLSQVKNQHVHL